jgi:hypothetical protein
MKPDPENSIGTHICFAAAALLASIVLAVAGDTVVSNLTAA